MTIWAPLTDPLYGKASLSRVVWGYGLGGSLLYGALEFLLDPGNTLEMRLYSLGGLLVSIYVCVATYRCAFNCRSRLVGRLAQVSAVLSLLLLPVLAYVDWTGLLNLALIGEQ